MFPGGSFKHIWCIDFEYLAGDGERPNVVCLVAYDVITGAKIGLWRDQLIGLNKAPFATGPDSLIVMYYGPAEMGVFHALAWPLPIRTIDLFAEFRVETNGHLDMFGNSYRNSFLDALKFFNLTAISAQEKAEMRDLVLRGGPWSASEKRSILTYCEQDVNALARLWKTFSPKILEKDKRAGQALLRGQYGAAVGYMEHNGIPIDMPTMNRLQKHWDAISAKLIEEIDLAYGVYDGKTFKIDKFTAWLAANGIPWPLTATGKPMLDKETFQQQKRAHPQVSLLAELRTTINAMKLNRLAVGSDGRNRVMLSPFHTKTGRNQPSSARFIFGPSTWVRGLIKPHEGSSLAYLDWSAQEIYIAATLSGDVKLKQAYATGDVYLAFAKLCGLVPEEGTKESYADQRNQCKEVVLGLQYGRQAKSTANLLGVPVPKIQNLIDQYWARFSILGAWLERQINIGLMGMPLVTRLGWQYLECRAEPNPRTLMNFQMQSTGADMMRVAACMAREAGLKICAPVHDALILEAPTAQLEANTAQLKQIMETASSAVTDCYDLQCGVDVLKIRFPDRYMDEKRGRQMWETIMRLLEEAEVRDAA